MEIKIILFLCLVISTQCLNSDIHEIVKRQADLIDFTPQCSAVFTSMDVKCLTNIYSLVETIKSLEKDAVIGWATQCNGNVYDCISSHDGDSKRVIEYFKVLLPQIKGLCAEGCMVPIIDLIHSCLKQEALDEMGLSRSETEDIFDLVCIQEADGEGEEGEYCMIKALTTASYLHSANQIQNCNLDSIDLPSCGQDSSNPDCQCHANCSALIKSSNALMGCCMGTILELERTFNMTHPDSEDLLNPGNQLFKLCGVEPGPSCKTSKQVIADQEQQYSQCDGAIAKNSQSECIKLEEDTHSRYLTDMQNIHKTCQSFKNINQCRNSTAHVDISDDLLSVLTKLNNHCSECGAELAGIKENCTVFLPQEAKMVFEMMCLKNSDMDHCGPKVIVYEAERERQDLNSNPCFKGFMSKVQNQCSEECQQEVDTMNKYNVLNCFDALIEHSSYSNSAWQLWHRNCVTKPGVEVLNKIDVTSAYDFSKSEGSKSSIVKTVAYTFVGTVLLALVVVGAVLLIYKRQMLLNMFGYNKFEGNDNLITDVHMEDTMGSDYDDRGENYYD